SSRRAPPRAAPRDWSRRLRRIVTGTSTACLRAPYSEWTACRCRCEGRPSILPSLDASSIPPWPSWAHAHFQRPRPRPVLGGVEHWILRLERSSLLRERLRSAVPRLGEVRHRRPLREAVEG